MMPGPAPLPPPGGPPAGWYPDPTGWGMRYFDGREWATAQARPIPVEPVREPHPTLRLTDALVALAILFVSLVIAKVVSAVVVDLGASVLVDAAVALVLAYGPSLWWCWRVSQRERAGPQAVGWRFQWVDAGWGPLLYVGAMAGQIIVLLVLVRLGVPFTSNVENTSDLDRTASYVVALIATAVVAAPLVEELVFRGVVLRGLTSRLGVVAAVPLQGALFGAAHVDPSRGAGNIGLAIALGTVGCAFGLVAALTRRLGAPIIAHAILNGVVVTLVLTGVTDDLERDFGVLLALVR
jgi:membrane protease YdiL (CAAX protease family)